jgi:transcriptional regulator with XRE-family HTH domain
MYLFEYNVRMDKNQLKFTLSLLRLSPVELARLLGITPRAVSLWLSGERGVPGPAEAYLNLFIALTLDQRAEELRKLEAESIAMKDGMYSIEYQGTGGAGFGVLIFDGGRVYGSDVGMGKYDGSYLINKGTGLVDVKVRVELPANQPSVLGLTNPYDWAIDIETTIAPNSDAGVISAVTALGTVSANYKYLRGLPTE